MPMSTMRSPRSEGAGSLTALGAGSVVVVVLRWVVVVVRCWAVVVVRTAAAGRRLLGGRGGAGHVRRRGRSRGGVAAVASCAASFAAAETTRAEARRARSARRCCSARRATSERAASEVLLPLRQLRLDLVALLGDAPGDRLPSGPLGLESMLPLFQLALLLGHLVDGPPVALEDPSDVPHSGDELGRAATAEEEVEYREGTLLVRLHGPGSESGAWPRRAIASPPRPSGSPAARSSSQRRGSSRPGRTARPARRSDRLGRSPHVLRADTSALRSVSSKGGGDDGPAPCGADHAGGVDAEAASRANSTRNSADRRMSVVSDARRGVTGRFGTRPARALGAGSSWPTSPWELPILPWVSADGGGGGFRIARRWRGWVRRIRGADVAARSPRP